MKWKTLFVPMLLLLPLAIFLPYLGSFAYPFHSTYSDLTISHFPNLVYLQHALQTWGEVPLWSDAILGGYPFAADPLSGLWYPPGWLLIVLPQPLGFNLLILLHLWAAGMGMAAFLRWQGSSWLPAVAGGLLVELAPKLLAHDAAGHVTLVFAFAWTPWLLLVERRRFAAPFMKKGLAPAGLLYGMMLLADVRWAAYAGLLWFFYSLHSAIREGQWFQGGSRQAQGLGGVGRRVGRWLAGFLGQFALGILIAAPLLLPLAQFTQYATRRFLTPADNMALALSPARLLGLLIPDMAGYAEWIVYPGALAILMLAWVALQKKARRRDIFWIGVIIVALLWALGPAIPLLPVLARLPGLNLLRVPSRALLAASLAFAVISAHGIESLLEWKPQAGRLWRDPGWALVALAAFVVMLCAGLYGLSGSLSLEFAWGAAAAAIFTVLVLLRKAGRISPGWWGVLLLPLLVLDLGGIGFSQFEFRPAAVVLSQKELVVRYLALEAAPFRVYSPSYNLPQEIAATQGVMLADGINPLQLSAYAAFMEKASGVPMEGYSVTLPPFASGRPEVDNRAYLPDARLLGLLNVRYVVSEFELVANDLFLGARIGQTRIYRNAKALPRAWVQEPAGAIGQNIRPVAAVNLTANTVRLDAAGPGLLVLSEVDYPGWRVWVDGVEQPVQKVDGLLRGVLLDEGNHVVEFAFRPPLVYAGLGISGFTCLGLLVGVWWKRNRGRA